MIRLHLSAPIISRYSVPGRIDQGMRLSGVHLSIQGGVAEAILRSEALGCEAIQISTRNQRQWNPPPLKEDQFQAFRNRLAKSDIQTVVSHGSCLMNLASPDPDSGYH